MIKGAIFDMDGVLVDNLDAHIAAFTEFCRRHNTELTPADIDKLFGQGNDTIIPAILPAEVIEDMGIDALAAEKEAIYRELYAATIEPVAGLQEYLAELTAAGVRCAVGSSGPKENVDFVLSALDIEKYFDVKVNGDMVTRRKPDPEIFQTATRMLGYQPEECVVFEDSLSGIASAHAAENRVIGVATTLSPEKITANAKTDLIIKDFTELSAEQTLAIGK